MSLTRPDIVLILLILISFILFVFVIIEGLMIIAYKKKTKINGRKQKGSANTVLKKKKDNTEELEKLRSEVKHLKSLEEKNKELEKECDKRGKEVKKHFSITSQLESENSKLKQDIKNLEQKNNELTRANAELAKLADINLTSDETKEATKDLQAPIITISDSKEEMSDKVPKKSSQSVEKDVSPVEAEQKQNVSSCEPPKEPSKVNLKNEQCKEADPEVETVIGKVMYASFPRSAGNSNYFSDLSENRKDDSFFELRISMASGKATFKPLDFMKIRNYDPAMSVMITEGAKPNVASAVVGIEPGNAHLEGKDWIIDKLAKIKLA